MHDIAHPQLAGEAVGEAAPVGAVAGGGRLAHQALGTQQPVHGGVRRSHAVGQVAAGDSACDHRRTDQDRCSVLIEISSSATSAGSRRG